MRAERNTSAEHVNVQIHERVRTLLKTQYNGRSRRRLIKYKGTVRNARRIKVFNAISEGDEAVCNQLWNIMIDSINIVKDNKDE